MKHLRESEDSKRDMRASVLAFLRTKGLATTMVIAAIISSVFFAGRMADIREKEAKEAQKTITDFEEKWWKDCIGEFPSEPEGDGVAIARELVAKWKPFILKQADTQFRKNK